MVEEESFLLDGVLALHKKKVQGYAEAQIFNDTKAYCMILMLTFSYEDH